MKKWKDEKKLLQLLESRGIAVVPTDTLYGILASALSGEAVEKVYEIKKRDPRKPCLVLIADISEIKRFGIELSMQEENIAKQYWASSRPTTIAFECRREEFKFLHRGTNSIAFRLPKENNLVDFLKESGPLIAPSANPEGMPPAKNIRQAKDYFGSDIPLYIDGGTLEGKASRLIKLNKEGEVNIIRE